MVRKTKAEKIAAIELEIEQLKNEKKELEARERERIRKERTSRLCKRCGLLESMLPDTIPLSEERFKTFLEKTVANDFGWRMLATLKAEQEKEAAVISAKAGPPTTESPDAKPEQNNGQSEKTVASKPVEAVKMPE